MTKDQDLEYAISRAHKKLIVAEHRKTKAISDYRVAEERLMALHTQSRRREMGTCA
jgi:hypothetical protein